MLCINNAFTDAYFNIASEEYLLKNFQEDVFMLYQNEPSVIIGKHQNVRAEVNLDFAEKNKMKVVRRFSGGGTVFHDLGNLNLTFIETGYNLNFDRFTAQMIDCLARLGIYAESDKRRALNIGGLKISGSAQCVHKNRVMYHATLLFSSDLGSLITSLEGNSLDLKKESDKKIYVESVRSPVTNIIEHLDDNFSIIDFKKFIMNYFMGKNIENKDYVFSKKDILDVEHLMKNKYATQAWNYDASVANIK